MNHHGTGVVCPECSYLLKIPRSAQRRPAGGVISAGASGSGAASRRNQVADKELGKSGPVEVSEISALTKNPLSTATPSESTEQSQSKHAGGQASEVLPERKHHKKSSASGQVNALAWIIGGSLSGLAIVGIGVWLLIVAVNETKHPEYSEVSWPVPKSVTALAGEGEQMPGNRNKKAPKNRVAEALEIEVNMIDEFRELVSEFLNARTASDLEKLVRTPELTIPRLRAWYDQQKWEAPGLKDIAYKGRIKVEGTIASMDVRLNDYSVRQIAIEKTAGGYKIDWESWVAWSSMKWEDLFDKLPSDPVEVRVHCKRGGYYNNVFNDDKKWFAVRLEYPHSYRSIYGYIDKKSPQFNKMMAELNSGDRIMATLRIRYPEKTRINNQVYITEFVQKGWVRADSVKEGDQESIGTKSAQKNPVPTKPQ